LLGNIDVRGLRIGFQEAVHGIQSILRNPLVQKDYHFFLTSYGYVLVAMYITAVAACVLAFPVFLLILASAPGIIAQLFTLIPYWACTIATKRSPNSANKMFLDELQQLDPILASAVRDKLTESRFNARWFREAVHDASTSWHFTKYSLLFLLLAVLPFGSVLGWLAQVWLVADRWGWGLLSVYTQGLRQMSYREQKQWMEGRKWILMGFSLPFAVLISIPLVGPLLIGLAQAATANLLYDRFNQELREVANRRTPLASSE
jgi:uncharacterized protein involved in cysteine biosynthesis